MIDPGDWPLPELARAWREARPFPHVVLDGILGEEQLAALRRDLAGEPHWPYGDEHYSFLASSEPPQQPALRDFIAALASAPVLRAVEAISGQRLGSADGRAYVYLRGHYLLPHSDCRQTLRRAVAYAWYAMAEPPLAGGELELFDCTMDGDEVLQTAPAVRISPRNDRLVLFAVSPATLHQVCEVLEGTRASLAGWFYP